ncbi:hypothetical protein CRN76_10465 [Chryseobacterium indologenes]|uniref:hypothetical protein n=1 Tax=Chryseobacterium indologenes TaxID=253 RepID=UPI000B515287|nr:hypothetical protein [Chryseobacterium indologenes]ASE61848.1 hypothetical protein CEQ15_10310 [Chryseobacterium indologenes]ATN05786.1 hypothetical protein CRN76_10465 [Chryseobacterium indologenes]AYY85456.1 hypothetical protein EGX91_13280 [Chryseobacterium indologenes]QIX82352.1 hypothetical protein FOB56_14355 [Chryseobacterium indologenes]UDQ51987.1 hypothetical protein LJF28_11130 [Chryseobacterium indologenes]
MWINGKQFYVGMTKQELLHINGIGENLFSHDKWHYIIKKSFLYGKEVLFVEFEEDIAVHISIRHVFKKLNTPINNY